MTMRERGKSVHSEGGAEVVPVWVQRFDQGYLFGATPRFDFLFARDGRASNGVRLEPDEIGEVVLLCEAGDEFFFVLPYAFDQLAGHSDVEHA
jgi:hypothetical protein